MYYDSERGLNWFRYYVNSTSEVLRISRSDTEHEEIATKIDIKKTLIPNYQKFDYSSAIQFCSDRNKVHDLIEKHIAIKPEIMNQVDTFVENNFGNDSYIIGVHYHSSRERYINPKVSVKKIVDTIRCTMSHTHKPCKVFVSTNDDLFIHDMKREFPDQAVWHYKLSEEQEVPFQAEKQTGYEDGRRSLVTCLLLAKSGHIISTGSHLSATAEIFNPKVEVTRLEENWLNQ